MAYIYKLALLAIAALAAIAAPIETSSRHTTAAAISFLGLGNSTVSTGFHATGSTYSGRGTWFTDKSGSCGVSFDTNDMIAAVNEAQMGRNTKCGMKIRVNYQGKSVTVKVVDTCPSRYCSSGALDLSQAAFKRLAPLDKGEIYVKWEFV
ncbi:MAG: RlpA-like double-psi beta-barrel-protein domain-containing protein-containing protein [Benniella sp.]|nr:MAG: RlpA-like double-psi beta-barrel-protein domain-containing protein-containing protein [Benniella sp.]